MERLLGVGGMGAVYLVEHTVLRRHLALKVIRPNLLTDPTLARRLRREAEAASRIDHPNVTYVLDYGEDESGQAYLAMEYVAGATLAEVLKRDGRFDVRHALHLLAQACDGLAAAHQAGVVHRDLKPNNIVLTRDADRRDVLKILDFGVAKVTGLHSSLAISMHGTAGTPDYMSPEHCAGDPVDHRSDIYSLGIVAFELLVGRPPFTGGLTAKLSAHVIQKPPVPSIASGRQDINNDVDQLILRCLAKHPEERPQTATALAKELRVLHAQLMGTGPGHPAIRDDSPTMPPISRSEALEELTREVRRAGAGTAEIIELLAERVDAEDDLMAAVSNVTRLEAERDALISATNSRLARLGEVSKLLKLERASATAGGDLESTLRGGYGKPQADSLLRRLRRKIDHLPDWLGSRVAELDAHILSARTALGSARKRVDDHEERLLVQLQDIVQANPSILTRHIGTLCMQAGIEMPIPEETLAD
ncbi:MAG: protein kinase [Myxococcales bacterium]|nr:protein kinase [Myxococcales bacterium]